MTTKEMVNGCKDENLLEVYNKINKYNRINSTMMVPNDDGTETLYFDFSDTQNDCEWRCEFNTKNPKKVELYSLLPDNYIELHSVSRLKDIYKFLEDNPVLMDYI